MADREARRRAKAERRRRRIRRRPPEVGTPPAAGALPDLGFSLVQADGGVAILPGDSGVEWGACESCGIGLRETPAGDLGPVGLMVCVECQTAAAWMPRRQRTVDPRRGAGWCYAAAIPGSVADVPGSGWMDAYDRRNGLPTPGVIRLG